MLSARRFIFVVIAALVMANAYCVAACAANDCIQPLQPPCHRHHDKAPTTAKPCINSAVVADSGSTGPRLERQSVVGLVDVTPRAADLALTPLRPLALTAASPPGSADRPFPLALRI